MPKVTRIKLSALRKHIPADTPAIEEAERKRRLLARFKGAQLRTKW
jgi:hypothetical protein